MPECGRPRLKGFDLLTDIGEDGREFVTIGRKFSSVDGQEQMCREKLSLVLKRLAGYHA